MHDVAWRGMWICVRSKDAQKQLARTSLNQWSNQKLVPEKIVIAPSKIFNLKFDYELGDMCFLFWLPIFGNKNILIFWF